MFAHSGMFSVPPPIHPSMYGFDSRPGHTRSSSLRNVSSTAGSASRPIQAPPIKPTVDTRRLRQRTLPAGGDEVVALKTLKFAQHAPVDQRSALSGDFLIERIKNLTQLCKTEELRVQQLEGSIKHKLSEYPTVIERMTALDQQAMDIYDSLMATTGPGSTTSPIYAGRLSPAARSDGEDRETGYTGPDPQRLVNQSSAAQRLEQLSVHLRAAQKAVEENEGLMRDREEKLRSAEAVLSRDQDIIQELERRIQVKKADIAAIRARQQLQNIALTTAAVIGGIVFVILAVYLSIKRDTRAG